MVNIKVKIKDAPERGEFQLPEQRVKQLVPTLLSALEDYVGHERPIIGQSDSLHEKIRYNAALSKQALILMGFTIKHLIKFLGKNLYLCLRDGDSHYKERAEKAIRPYRLMWE